MYNFISFLKSNSARLKNRNYYKKLLHDLNGLFLRHNNPQYPDFILSLKSEKKAIKEIVQKRLPLIGLNNTSINNDLFLYSLVTNNNSIEVIS